MANCHVCKVAQIFHCAKNDFSPVGLEASSNERCCATQTFYGLPLRAPRDDSQSQRTGFASAIFHRICKQRTSAGDPVERGLAEGACRLSGATIRNRPR
jgi:hypothetical protein